MIGLLYFVYGVIFGSFYNVVIYRVPNNMNVASGNSKCPNCNTRIKYSELIPIISWLHLRGRSTCCNQKISVMYPIIEFITGLLFLASYLTFGSGVESIYYIMLFSFLVIVGAIDFKHKVIYDIILIIFFIIAIVFQLLFIRTISDSLIGSIVAYVFYFGIYFVVKKIYKEERFGLGDALFIGVIGFYIGTKFLYYVLFGPFYLATLYFLIVKFVLKKDMDLKDEVPFGPFISASTILVVLIMNFFFY